MDCPPGRFQPLEADEALGLQMSDVNGLNAGRASGLCVTDGLGKVLPSVGVKDVSADSVS